MNTEEKRRERALEYRENVIHSLLRELDDYDGVINEKDARIEELEDRVEVLEHDLRVANEVIGSKNA